MPAGPVGAVGVVESVRTVERTPAEKPTVWESIQLEAGELVGEVKRIMEDTSARRIIVKHEGTAIFEIPLAVGLVGTFLAPALAAVGALAALLNDCEIVVEREEETAHETSPATTTPYNATV
jgi:hypothetical protein